MKTSRPTIIELDDFGPRGSQTSGNNAKTKHNANEDSCIKGCPTEVKNLDDFFSDFRLPEQLKTRLFSHQKEGVKWMYERYKAKSGGILGDDMGLGKTFQVSCLLTGLMLKREIRRVLILAPLSVVRNWQRELETHLKPHVRKVRIDMILAEKMHKGKRERALDDVFSEDEFTEYKHIVLSSYQLAANMIESFAQGSWDYVILDEGHVIKNPQTKVTTAASRLKTAHRLLLTGTPIQNNLNEFWTLVNWATKGRVFGSLASFKKDISNPIKAGQDPLADPQTRACSEEAVRILVTLTKPILLQRKKIDQPSESLKLPEKSEVVIWIPLATKQRGLYEKYIMSRKVANVLQRATYPVELVNHLKTICRHPFLLDAYETNQKRKGVIQDKSARCDRIGRNRSDDDVDALNSQMGSLNLQSGKEPVEACILDKLASNANVFDIAARDPDLHELLQGSVKLRVLAKLAFRLHSREHRTLIFSQSKMMLDIIQRVLAEYSLATYRIDGSVSGENRQRIIDDFNDISDDHSGPSICLLTTKACGFGITLTGADRVIIFDPSWNPAEDRQAVDRAFRIGQKKNVVVYRLICAATVEEKMYEKQVFKDGLRVVSESGDVTGARYFSSEETSELFTLGPAGRSLVMEKLWELAGKGPMETYEDVGDRIPGVLGFTRHDQLYNERLLHNKDRQVSGAVGSKEGITPIVKSDTKITSGREIEKPKPKKTPAQSTDCKENRSSSTANIEESDHMRDNPFTSPRELSAQKVYVDVNSSDEDIPEEEEEEEEEEFEISSPCQKRLDNDDDASPAADSIRAYSPDGVIRGDAIEEMAVPTDSFGSRSEEELVLPEEGPPVDLQEYLETSNAAHLTPARSSFGNSNDGARDMLRTPDDTTSKGFGLGGPRRNVDSDIGTNTKTERNSNKQICSTVKKDFGSNIVWSDSDSQVSSVRDNKLSISQYSDAAPVCEGASSEHEVSCEAEVLDHDSGLQNAFDALSLKDKTHEPMMKEQIGSDLLPQTTSSQQLLPPAFTSPGKSFLWSQNRSFSHFKKIEVRNLCSDDEKGCALVPSKIHSDFLEKHDLTDYTNETAAYACQDIHLYNRYVDNASELESTNEYFEACKEYLKAFEIWDGDTILHGKLAWLSTKISRDI